MDIHECDTCQTCFAICSLHIKSTIKLRHHVLRKTTIQKHFINCQLCLYLIHVYPGPLGIVCGPWGSGVEVLVGVVGPVSDPEAVMTFSSLSSFNTFSLVAASLLCGWGVFSSTTSFAISLSLGASVGDTTNTSFSSYDIFGYRIAMKQISGF